MQIALVYIVTLLMEYLLARTQYAIYSILGIYNILEHGLMDRLSAWYLIGPKFEPSSKTTTSFPTNLLAAESCRNMIFHPCNFSAKIRISVHL